MSDRKIYNTKNAPGALGPYNQAVSAAGLLFTAGQVPLNPATGKMVDGGIREQTARVMENLQAILQAAGLGFGDVIKATVFMANMGDFADFNEVYATFFEGFEPPARSAFQVAALPLGAGIEIEMIARLA
jgi:2-iminobutanoate/2-iminopropanoate deaminase